MKHLKIHFQLLACGIFLLASSSCSKSFLDQKPGDAVAAEDALKTAADMRLALNGAYGLVKHENLYGLRFPVLGDLLADNVFLSAVNVGRFNGENAYVITKDGAASNGVWTTGYQGVLYVNNIIDAPLSAGADVRQCKGEAYALRALFYFDMVRLFGKAYTDDAGSLGVPLVLHYDPAALPERNTVAAVYTQILSDLDQAYALMSIDNGSATFSKYAARALAAKVNFYKGDYQKAYDEANGVINDSGFTLLTRDDFADYWTAVVPHDAGNKEETLFEAVSDAVYNNGVNELGRAYSQESNSDGDLLTTSSVYNLYDTTDVRKNLILTGKRQGAGGEDPAYIVNKYPAISDDYNDKKVLRLSEVYLIAAESAYRLGKTNEALSYLNTLVAQRDPSLVYASAGVQLLNDIINERRKELAFEGDRFFDLNRLKADILRTPEYPSGIIKAGDNRRVMPIPQAETNSNPHITQNPGY